MRAFKTTMMMICFTLFFLGGSVFAGDVGKIGILDFQKVLTDSAEGMTAKSEINAKGKKMEADLKEKGTAIEELKKQFERESLVMSREQREEKERDLRIRINDFKTVQKRFMANFKELEGKLVNRIKKDVFEIVEKLGKDEGFLLIIERREAGVMYFPESIDITDKIIGLYDKKTAN